MNKKFLSILLTLVLALSLCLVTAGPVAAQTTLTPNLISAGDGSAVWSTGEVITGNGPYSVLLDAGDIGDTGDGGVVKVFVDPIAIASFTGTSYYVWEPTGTEHGGEFPYVTAHPYGDPYINIYLDTDGDGVFDDYLEGLGSITFGSSPQPTTHPTPAAETWVQMEEGYGFYDSDNSLGQGTWITAHVVGTLADWKTYLAATYPLINVVGVQIVFGFWADDVTPDVYIDDVEISGVTYDLEPDTGGDTTIDAEVAGVTSITPNSGDINTTLEVVIAGFGFTDASAVDFGADIAVDSYVVDTNTQITADLTIAANAAAGSRDVTVTILEGDIVGSGLFTVEESFTLAAPSGIDLGMMLPGTTTGSSLTAGTVVTNIVVPWTVEAADLKAENTGYMENATPTPLNALFEISEDGAAYQTALAGLTYEGNPTTLDFFVSQLVGAGDEVGSYTITITFTGSY